MTRLSRRVGKLTRTNCTSSVSIFRLSIPPLHRNSNTNPCKVRLRPRGIVDGERQFRNSHFHGSEELVNGNFEVADRARFDLGLLDGPLHQHKGLRLDVSLQEPNGEAARRNGLRKFQHLLRDLMLVVLFREEQHTLESVDLLTEGEENDLGTCMSSISTLFRPQRAHPEAACCAVERGK